MVKKTIKVWDTDSILALQGCFECTDWDVFLDASENVDEAVNVMTDYVNNCVQNIIPTKTIKLFPNNKAHVTKEIKETINLKKQAHIQGNKIEENKLKGALRAQLVESKRKEKEKVESKFATKNLSEAFQGLKLLTGQVKPKPSNSFLPENEKLAFAGDLNHFYTRFERDDLKDDLNSMVSFLKDEISKSCADDIEVDENTVRSYFSKLNIRKACGPDGLSGRVLRYCADQLCSVFTRLFTWALRDCVVPTLWKNSTICPVPKNNKPKSMNDYRPVALTSLVMKVFERIVLQNLLLQTNPYLDQNQFAYKPNRSTSDATLSLLHSCYEHLEKPNSFVRILFIDFSSAFNTIQPHLMARKLLGYGVEHRLVLWLINFLIDRTQSVCFQSVMSSSLETSTGAPQGTVLAPVLFTLYTNDCTGTQITPFIKYSDDTALVDLSDDDTIYFNEVSRFTMWCKNNFLDLNVSKTKEMVVDFRKQGVNVSDLFIDGVKVERVSEYKYLGTVLDEKLNFNANTNYLHKKCQSRIYLLQKLRNLNVNSYVMKTFYRSFIESILTFSFISWYSCLTMDDRKKVDRVVRVCGKIVGENQESLSDLYKRRCVQKAKSIITDSNHVLAHNFELLPSGRRYREPFYRLKRTKNTFIPQVIKFLNMKK